MEHSYEGFVNNLSWKRRPRQYKHKTGWKITHLEPFSVFPTPTFGATVVSGLSFFLTTFLMIKQNMGLNRLMQHLCILIGAFFIQTLGFTV
jgi:hypothetical protein